MRLLLFLTLLPQLASAQTADTTRRAPGATVSGIVRDSITHLPLAGAIVQLVAADTLARVGRTAVSDSLGQFTLDDVPAGRYTIGFFHPVLDSLGVDPPMREISVVDRRPVRADVGVPSPARLRAAICGPRLAPESTSVIIGVVLDARDHAPAAGVTVTAEWLELSIRAGGFVRRISRLAATTRENGWFAMCGVPSPGTMLLTASRGADSTDLIEVQVPSEGFLRRHLYLGAARTVTVDSAQHALTSLPLARRVRMGGGNLTGTVVTAAEGRMLQGAQVSISGGLQTHTNERGEWTLVDVPAGTRMLEVRALGYYPERRRVDVVAGAESIRVALATLKSVLDTVRVTATRYKDRDRLGFQERHRSGAGRYLTQQDIARQQPLHTSDLFRAMAGIHLVLDSIGFEKWLFARGDVADWCLAELYLDGVRLSGISADDLDVWVRPKEIAGIEVYSGTGAPTEFQQGMTGCGSIVIWTQ